MKGDFRRRNAMTALLALMISLPAEPAPAPPVKVDVMFTRVAPAGDKEGRSRDQTRAVVLIHGLSLLPILKDKKLGLRTWQQSDSVLVKQLAPHADVYAFAYSQSTSVDQIHEGAKLLERV